MARPSACCDSSWVPATTRKLNAEELSAAIDASSDAPKSSTRRSWRIGNPSCQSRRNSATARPASAAATTSSPRSIPSNPT
jgi:hypothetical protein